MVASDEAPQLPPGSALTSWIASRAIPQLLDRYHSKVRQGPSLESVTPAPPLFSGPHEGAFPCARVIEAGKGDSLSGSGSPARQGTYLAARPGTLCADLLIQDTNTQYAR